MCFDSRVLIKVTTTITQNWTARVNCVAAYIHHVRPVYRLKAHYSALVTAGPCQVHESEDLSFPARELSSVQDGIYALGKAHMCSTPSLRRFPNGAFKTGPMFVWLTMALSRPFMEDRLALPLSTPLSSRIWDRWCDVIGFVPAGSVSSSSTFQIIWDTSYL